MPHPRSFMFLAALLLLFAAPARAGDESAPSAPESPAYNYLTPSQPGVAALQKPFPPQSALGKADIRQILLLQQNAPPLENAMARAEQNLQPDIITNILGNGFGRDDFPATFALLDKAGHDSRLIAEEAKNRWRLPRPYVADKRVKLAIPPLPATSYAYPSAHTGAGLVWAQILGELIPEAKYILAHQASRVATRQVVAGVHYPQDITGGMQLGKLIYDKMQASPAYQADLAAARAELAAADYAWVPPGCRPAPPARKNWKSFKSRITE